VSFITSIFAMWQLLTGDITVRLYMIYVVLLFATHHADILYRLRRFEKKLDNIITANYFLMAMVVIMLFAVILAVDAASLGEFFYRLLAALGITDATLTITAIIMHKLFLQKHPELAASADQDASAQSKSFWKNPLVILLMIFLAFQIIGSIFALVFQGF